jgi:plasmid stability protein
VKTTLEIPDELMRAIKVKAAMEDRKLKDLVVELLERGLKQEAVSSLETGHRVKLPLIQTGRRDDENLMRPERVAEILLEQEVEAYSG